MRTSSSWTPRLLAASLTFVTVLGTAAWAQQPPTVRIRGTIETVDGPMLSIKSREGTDMKVRVTDNVAVFGVAKTELSEIKEGSYIGVTAVPEPDGTQKAVAVHIFPENQRGASEGFRLKRAQSLFGISTRIQRQRRMVFGKSLPVREPRLLLQMAGIGQELPRIKTFSHSPTLDPHQYGSAPPPLT